jgi:hypothetical protein
MNARTSKMLKRYARLTSAKEKELKAWWTSLQRSERTRERERILEALGEDE